MTMQLSTSGSTERRVPGTEEFRLGVAVLAILVLTSVHHVWGAYVFDTPFRLHIVFVAIPVAAVILGLLYLAATRQGTAASVARWAAILASALLPIAMIGIYEGGFNHIFKNVEFFLLGEDAARATFPAPTHEMPSDVFFEVSGALQFPAALLAAREVWRLLRARR